MQLGTPEIISKSQKEILIIPNIALMRAVGYLEQLFK